MAKGKGTGQSAQDEAKRILDRIESDTESIGTSSMARSASKVSDHFAGSDNPDDDKIEILGKRIGRGLSLIVFVILAVYLIYTYVLN